jgi:hypothetical protein
VANSFCLPRSQVAFLGEIPPRLIQCAMCNHSASRAFLRSRGAVQPEQSPETTTSPFLRSVSGWSDLEKCGDYSAGAAKSGTNPSVGAVGAILFFNRHTGETGKTDRTPFCQFWQVMRRVNPREFCRYGSAAPRSGFVCAVDLPRIQRQHSCRLCRLFLRGCARETGVSTRSIGTRRWRAVRAGPHRGVARRTCRTASRRGASGREGGTQSQRVCILTRSIARSIRGVNQGRESLLTDRVAVPFPGIEGP